MVEAADLFNASEFRRTIGGIAKSLGEPQASDRAALRRRTPRSWSRVAWDISWYQYRVTPGLGAAGAPGRARARARASSRRRSRAGTRSSTPDGRVVPDIAPASSADPRPPYNQRQDDLLRDPARARGRALRQDGRVLQGQPERDGDRRPARRARPPAARAATTGGKREIRDRRRARIPGTFPETERPTLSRIAAVAITATKTFQNFIGGEWVDAASGETFETTQPRDRRDDRRLPDARAPRTSTARSRRRRRPTRSGGSSRRRSAARSSSASRSCSREQQGRAHRADGARDGQGAAPRPAATSRKRST